MTLPVSLIVAMAKNRVIGKDNDLPWRLKEDLKFFKATTLGKPMIMGRKTFDSIGRPLPGRTTIVVTRDPDWKRDDVLIRADIDSALAAAQEVAAADGAEEVIVAGGGEIYRQTLDRADRIYITEVNAEPDGDARFPAFDRDQWRETTRKPGESRNPTFDFVTLERRDLA